MTHLLCIEPNIVLARTYTRAFELAGYSVNHARDAQTAVHAADERQPDMVILELQLAGHDGIEFLHEFRSYPEWQRIPVIILSNVLPSSLVPLEHSLQRDLGVQACLYKPQTSLQKLLRVVGQQIQVV